ncbi:TonB-linked outer membrane protein, SusC/RagA family [bacterium A37T11]|nr:TonB-linked outer membrane protein, SusC/RagA family [bacterium A37T11]
MYNKNTSSRYRGRSNCLIKCIVFMKFFLLFTFIASIQVNAKTFAQSITLVKKNVRLPEVFKEISRQTGYHIFYDFETIDFAAPVSLSFKNAGIQEVIEKCLAGQHLDYQMVDKNIVISKKKITDRNSGSNSSNDAIQNVQDIEIRGTVRDSTGAILTSVNIKVKNKSSIGTSTDVNGKYVLTVPVGSILVFSMVGFENQEVSTSGKEIIDVILRENQSMLDDVVITAFGGQTKRTDMIGSVTSVKPSDLKVPSSNLTTALAGKVAGMIAYQRSGEPGQDNAEFFIRGVTTFGYKVDPLILIDNMEVTTTELARIQPDDIASFSIMKDATATALYGARGANGVILVTTKQGVVGKANLTFRIENSVSKATRDVELADPVTYMKMYNEAVLTRIPLGEVNANYNLYSDEKIENTLNGSNPLVYPANDWRKILFKNNTQNQRANLSISGGGGVAQYYVSGSFNKDNGIMKVDPRNNFNNNIDLKSYTLRSNVTIDVTKTSKMIVRLNGNFDDYTGPIDGGTSMYRKIMRSNPVRFPAYYPKDTQHQFIQHIMFGNFDEGQYINPYAEMVKGYKDYSRSLMLAQIEIEQKLNFFTEGLSFRTMLNTNRTSYFDVNRFYNPYWYTLSGYNKLADTYTINNIPDVGSTEYLNYNEGPKTLNSSFYLESMLNYNRTFGEKHNLSGLLVYVMRQRLNANAGDIQLSLPFRNTGLSGRTTYSYDNRYFAEFNFGYNGSERFHESKRFGFFPSFGLAWSISNEKFMQPYKNTVSNLRLRATYGLVGNDAIGSDADRFFYLSNVNMNSSARQATFGRDQTNTKTGVLISRYSNPEITWEVAKKGNVALELGLFNNFTLQAEYFREYRSNILMTRSSIPSILGFAAPIRANVGEASNRGTDISLDYSHSFANGFYLSARGNFTYASSRYEVYEEPDYDEKYRSRVGYSLSQTMGYIAERLFIDDEEALNSPKQNFGTYAGGDIKFLDVNRDGQITPADQVAIGNPTVPEIVYGFGFSLSYKGLDFSSFFQGLTNESFWIDVNATSPFASYKYPNEVIGGTLQNQVLKAYADSYWSEDRRDVNALWPRLSPTVNSNNAQPSTWFMQDGTFLRLKQVELGYTLPSHWLSRLNITNFRIYVNATNLLTFSKFRLWDVEMGGNGLGYPIQKVFNVGVNVNIH